MNAAPDRAHTRLQVRLLGQVVGTLGSSGTAAGNRGRSHLAMPSQGWLQFRYHRDWLARPDAVPLSLHLPLQAEAFGHWPSLAFFGSLLPSGDMREALAQRLQTSQDDDIALLDALGTDLLGAVTLHALPPNRRRWKAGTLTLEQLQAEAQQLSFFDDPDIRQDLPALPAGQVERSACISLLLARPQTARGGWPGEHTLVPLWQQQDGQDVQPCSSHLLWLAAPGHDAELFQRLWLQQRLQAMGVPVMPMQAMPPGEMTALLQLRPDRYYDDEQRCQRWPAETLGQALGLAPGAIQSRQAAGWPAAFALLRAQVRPHASLMLQLLDAIITGVLFGMADMAPHQLLLRRPRSAEEGVTLAPLHDLRCQPGAQRMALSIGRHQLATPPGSLAWERFALDCQLSPNQVRKRVRQLAQALEQQLQRQQDEQDDLLLQRQELQAVAAFLLVRARALQQV